MTEDSTSGLEELRIDKQRAAMMREANGGASVTFKDGRVSKALGWFWGIVGTAIAGSVLLAANNLYQLNLTVARGLDADVGRDRTLADHETRLRQVERDVSTWQGKNLRGHPVPQENKP